MLRLTAKALRASHTPLPASITTTATNAAWNQFAFSSSSNSHGDDTNDNGNAVKSPNTNKGSSSRGGGEEQQDGATISATLNSMSPEAKAKFLALDESVKKAFGTNSTDPRAAGVTKEELDAEVEKLMAEVVTAFGGGPDDQTAPPPEGRPLDVNVSVETAGDGFGGLVNTFEDLENGHGLDDDDDDDDDGWEINQDLIAAKSGWARSPALGKDTKAVPLPDSVAKALGGQVVNNFDIPEREKVEFSQDMDKARQELTRLLLERMSDAAGGPAGMDLDGISNDPDGLEGDARIFVDAATEAVSKRRPGVDIAANGGMDLRVLAELFPHMNCIKDAAEALGVVRLTQVRRIAVGNHSLGTPMDMEDLPRWLFALCTPAGDPLGLLEFVDVNEEYSKGSNDWAQYGHVSGLQMKRDKGSQAGEDFDQAALLKALAGSFNGFTPSDAVAAQANGKITLAGMYVPVEPKGVWEHSGKLGGEVEDRWRTLLAAGVGVGVQLSYMLGYDGRIMMEGAGGIMLTSLMELGFRVQLDGESEESLEEAKVLEGRLHSLLADRAGAAGAPGQEDPLWDTLAMTYLPRSGVGRFLSAEKFLELDWRALQ